MSVTLETKLWITHIWISNSSQVNLHMYHFSCRFQCYVQCSVIKIQYLTLCKWSLEPRFFWKQWSFTYYQYNNVCKDYSILKCDTVSLDNWFLKFWKDRSPSSPKLQGPWTFNTRRSNIHQSVRNHLPINVVTHTRKPESSITIEKNSKLT